MSFVSVCVCFLLLLHAYSLSFNFVTFCLKQSLTCVSTLCWGKDVIFSWSKGYTNYGSLGTWGTWHHI